MKIEYITPFIPYNVQIEVKGKRQSTFKDNTINRIGIDQLLWHSQNVFTTTRPIYK